MPNGVRSAVLGTLLLCGTAQADVFNIGSNPVDQSFLITFPAVAGGTTFSDTVLFSVTGPRGLVSTAFSNWPVPTAVLRNFTLELFQGTTLLASEGPSAVTFPGPGAPVFTQEFLTSSLAGGDYRLVLSGDVRPDGGFYTWTVSTVGVAPIPEPEQWALLLAGLALVAGVAKRRSKIGMA